MSKKNLCDVSKCHAACCYNVPMEKGFLSVYKKKIVNPVKGLGMYEDMDKTAYRRTKMGNWGRASYLTITNGDPAENKCPFLRDDCKCNIYEHRPAVCRRFGVTPGEPLLHCEYIKNNDKANEQKTVESIRFLARRFSGEAVQQHLHRKF